MKWKGKEMEDEKNREKKLRVKVIKEVIKFYVDDFNFVNKVLIWQVK